MNWTKIKEKIQDHIVTAVLSLVTFLCVVIWQAVPSQTWARVLEAIPKPALAALLGISLIGLTTALAYIFSLRRTPKPKKKPFYNIMADEEYRPFCPVCDVLLSRLRRKDETDFVHPHYQCPKCKFIYEINPP